MKTEDSSPSLPVESKESRHTPGPWAFELEWMPTGREESIVGRDGFPIANVRGTDDMSCIDEEEEEKFAAECKANAELIRSAPEMFEELSKLREENKKLYRIIELSALYMRGQSTVSLNDIDQEIAALSGGETDTSRP